MHKVYAFLIVTLHAGLASPTGREAPKPVYQDRQQLFNRIAPVYDQVSHSPCMYCVHEVLHAPGMFQGLNDV